MASKPQKLMLRVVRGGFEPADEFVRSELRRRGYRVGQIVAGVITKTRSPGFHRLAHRLGTLCAQNIEDFAGMDAHAVLKRLQWEANIGCSTMGAKVPGVGFVEVRIPESLSFDNMDQTAFKDVVRGFCRHIAERYWPDMEPEEIEKMASCMVDE